MANAIELKTAPADFRFPTITQTRHCFSRYIEFHRCLAAKGEGSNHVRNLPNTTVLFVLVNGLRSGMNRGKMVLSRVLCDSDHTLESR